MANHPNFYENTAEARMRLRDTVVLYDGHPHYVINVADHFKDGAIRIYLVRLDADNLPAYFTKGAPVTFGWGDSDSSAYPKAVDDWLEKSEDTLGVVRKRMDSPKFAKFRPFELGNVNFEGGVFYTIRSPRRSTSQGLANGALASVRISLSSPTKNPSRAPLSYYGPSYYWPEMVRTILNQYPSAADCLSHLTSDKCDNEGLAFHREFSFIRGPIDTIFLSYKNNVVGILPNADFSRVKITKQFGYAKDALAELELFEDIVA